MYVDEYCCFCETNDRILACRLKVVPAADGKSIIPDLVGG